jgi:hypothetical protein
MKVHPIDMNVSIHITQGGNGSQGDLEWLVPWKWGNREGIPDKIRHVVGLPYYVEIEEARDGSLDRLWYRSKGNRRYRQVIAEARWEHLILLETTIRRLVFRVVLPGWVSEEEILGKVMAKARKHTRAVVKRIPALGKLDVSVGGSLIWDGYDREVGLLFSGGRLVTARAMIFDRESCEAWAGVSIDGILAD